MACRHPFAPSSNHLSSPSLKYLPIPSANLSPPTRMKQTPSHLASQAERLTCCGKHNDTPYATIHEEFTSKTNGPLPLNFNALCTSPCANSPSSSIHKTLPMLLIFTARNPSTHNHPNQPNDDETSPLSSLIPMHSLKGSMNR